MASSFAWARLVIGEVTAAAVLGFLREVVRPMYRQAGWQLRRVLTDNGKEFKGVFAAGCERHGIRVTRTKPRHAWTNGFVERLQKTILHEHWRIAFRRQYFTGRGPCNARSIGFSSSTTMSGRIEATGSAGAPRPPYSKEPSPHELEDGCVNTFAKLDTLVPTVSSSSLVPSPPCPKSHVLWTSELGPWTSDERRATSDERLGTWNLGLATWDLGL